MVRGSRVHGRREQHDARPSVRGRHAFLLVDRDIIYILFYEVLLSVSKAAQLR